MRAELFIFCLCVLFATTIGVPFAGFADTESVESYNEVLEDVPPEMATKWPVILVPGLSGSKIEAKLNKTEVVHRMCAKKSDWFLIWLSLTEISPMVIKCFFDNFRLVYNETTGRTENAPGVETRVPDFGGTSAIEFLSYFRFSKTAYYYNLVRSLSDEEGYKRGLNIKGAPYDFRKAPYENEKYFDDLKELIETTYKENNDTPVVMICHSMGCLFSLYMFGQQEQAWKDKHIKSWITIAAPFGGATESLHSILSGYNFDLPFFYNVSQFRGLQQSFSSLTFLLPNPEVFGETTILRHNEKNYTAYEIPEILELTNHPNLYRMWLKSKDLISYEHPGVEIHCVYGRALNTHAVTVYDDESSFPDKPFIINGDGDGTVNTISAGACERWRKGSQEKGLNFTLSVFEGIRHSYMPKDVKVVSHIQSILRNLK